MKIKRRLEKFLATMWRSSTIHLSILEFKKFYNCICWKIVQMWKSPASKNDYQSKLHARIRISKPGNRSFISIAVLCFYLSMVRFQKNGCKKGFELRGAVSTNITSNFINITAIWWSDDPGMISKWLVQLATFFMMTLMWFLDWE